MVRVTESDLHPLERLMCETSVGGQDIRVARGMGNSPLRLAPLRNMQRGQGVVHTGTPEKQETRPDTR